MRTALAAVVVLAAMVVPRDALGILRLPVEGLALLAVALLLPARAVRPAATVAGTVLGVVAVLAVLDAGFRAVLARPFDPLLDATSVAAGVEFVAGSAGVPAAVGVATAAAVAALALVVGVALAVRHLARLAVAHRRTAARAVAVLTPVWVVAALLGAPVASAGAAVLVRDHAVQVRDGLADAEVFAAQLAADPYRGADGLLAALAGKDVVVAFVESYGRDAVDLVGPHLDAGTRDLAAAGFATRSGFLTSPVVGGNSWLAHATFLSGLRVDDQRRHAALVGSDRMTLSSAFGDAGWRTVGVMPGTTREWPEAGFYGYDTVHDFAALGYRGPDHGWATVPDQYTLAAFQRAELDAAHAPLMAEIALVSSHAPWAYVPPVLDWAAVGDGSVYRGVPPGPAEYAGAIAYSLDSIVSWVRTHGDDDLVLLVLGDHQPSAAVTGGGATADVPISVVTRDAAVLDRVASWDWTPGLRPAPDAPVWPMEGFRDRFLAAFSG
ncbi:sulfatase-like hydrolase/transferase [Pseudonocardia petroleophila]|uniref:sulfatase-like hydrolase/transferase n=1 Tax=Pseudonocardia petroleophila TaxID=37331 RepID=UPI00210377ED|nr:sulfatase-like hydrolase/transferase [Pseudonocardia petroleophila]